MIPAMAKRGYDKAYAAATAATAGGIGIIIPPSIPMVIYGVAGQQSIAKMFMGGFIPGTMIALAFSAGHLYYCRNLDTSGLQQWSSKTLVKSLREGFWSMLAPLIILGASTRGSSRPRRRPWSPSSTPFVGVFIHRELKFHAFMSALKTTSC